MILREFLAIALGNLWRMKLRSALTIMGVVIGIGALVAMLSFAFGVQEEVTAEFEKIGLMRTLQVMPRSAAAGAAAAHGAGSDAAPDSARSGAAADTTGAADDGRPAGPAAVRSLDRAALEEIAAIPGVAFVYPQQAFDAQVRWDGGSADAGVQALPADFFKRRRFGRMIAGRFFEADSAAEAVVSQSWIRDRRLPADSLLGKTLTLRGADVPEIGLGLAARWLDTRGLPQRFTEKIVEVGKAVLRMFRPDEIRVRVVGIAEIEWGFGFRLGDIIVPPAVLEGRDFVSFSDPLELLAMLQSPAAAGWPMLVVTVEKESDRDRVQEAISTLGFHAENFVERFVDMRRGFLVMDAVAAVVGFIAIFVAALGISNTLIMSILERTREIGILRSLGAESSHIRLLFLAESAAIGAIGSLGGLLLGWIVSRAASVVARQWMIHQKIPPVDMFHLPAWVAASAVLFGILVSVMAGLYPARRASRVDPVQALRNE